jgi:hypothetical protein
MVAVMEGMRVVENGDHELQSVLQKGLKAQIASTSTLTPCDGVGHS